MSEITVHQIKGKDLSQRDLNMINRYRRVRLNRTSVWDHKENNKFHDRTFFLAKDGKYLLSFGTLRTVSIYIDEKPYDIWGLQAVISVIQGKGYGKALMQ